MTSLQLSACCMSPQQTAAGQSAKSPSWDVAVRRRPGVTVLFGRWQDVLPPLERHFDGIFFDTYSEFYGDMQCACIPALP